MLKNLLKTFDSDKAENVELMADVGIHQRELKAV